jgi:hypothetical protein
VLPSLLTLGGVSLSLSLSLSLSECNAPAWVSLSLSFSLSVLSIEKTGFAPTVTNTPTNSRARTYSHGGRGSGGHWPRSAALGWCGCSHVRNRPHAQAVQAVRQFCSRGQFAVIAHHCPQARAGCDRGRCIQWKICRVLDHRAGASPWPSDAAISLALSFSSFVPAWRAQQLCRRLPRLPSRATRLP